MQGVIVEKLIATQHYVSPDGTRTPFVGAVTFIEREGEKFTLGHAITATPRLSVEEQVQTLVEDHGFTDIRNREQIEPAPSIGCL